MCSISVSRVLRKVGAGVRPVDRPAESGHDPGFHGLWIGIVIGTGRVRSGAPARW